MKVAVLMMFELFGSNSGGEEAIGFKPPPTHGLWLEPAEQGEEQTNGASA